MTGREILLYSVLGFVLAQFYMLAFMDGYQTHRYQLARVTRRGNVYHYPFRKSEETKPEEPA